MKKDEMYEIYLQNREPCFYSRVPHIISYLTYDYIDPKTKKKEIKKLSVYARELYRVIKSIVNDGGVCWQNRNHLAELCGMSPTQITKAKKELIESFHQLNGKSLIEIKCCRKNNYNNNGKSGSTVFHKIMIRDIWGENNAYIKTKYLENQRVKKELGEALSQYDLDPGEALSQYDTNKNPYTNKNPQQQQPLKEMPAAPVVVSSKSKISPKEMTVCQAKRLRPIPKYTKSEKIKVITPIVESLYKLNITDELRLELSQKYTKEEIDRAVQRVLAWEGRQCDAKAIRSVLKKKDTWDDSTSDNICYKSDNLLLLRSLDCLDSKQFGSTYISIYLDYIQFSCGQSYKTFKVSEKDFKNNVEERLKNLKIKMTK